VIKQSLKFLHQLGAAGFIGALAAYLVLVATANPQSPAEYAAVRQGIAAICTWMLLPSLGVVLISGLLAIAAHRPFVDAGWAWLKAALGIVIFEGTLGAIDAKARQAAALSAKLAGGEGDPAVLAEIMRSEWIGLWTIMALAVANVVLAVWRPRLLRLPGRAEALSRSPSPSRGEGGGEGERNPPRPSG
jgi:hypothetical protein